MQQGWGKIAFGLFFYAIMALFFIGVIFVLSPKAKAAGDYIVINEIYPNQISGGTDIEWVELYDPSNSDFNLADYSLVKITGSGTEYKKPLSMAMCPRNDEYYICNLGINWLANSGATLVLRNNTIEIDRVTFGPLANNAAVPNQGQSISRIPNGIDTINDANDFQIVPITRGSENILPTTVIYSDKIYINELLPQPATGSADEYIELYNSSDIDIDLINWQLDAGTFEISTIVKAKEYRVFKNPEIKIGLTDTGDTTNLIDPSGDIKSAVTYGKTNRGQSYSKFTDSWQWTTTLTPAAENILTVEVNVPDQDAPILQTDIAGARNQPDGTALQVTGTVSVVPGKLSSQYFYIQDGISGVQIYSYDKLFPALSVGDQIQVTGELGSINGERRLKTSELSDIWILSTHPPPASVKTTISQIAENFEGQYISVVGTVTKTSGSTFYIHGSVSGGDPRWGEIEVSIRTGTGINKPRMSVGDRVQIAGILSQYGDNYRILPIVQSDVKIISSSGLPNSGSSVVYIIITAIIFSWITLPILLKKLRI
ncbi:MAG: lamin tail domain-containing protein [Candidatus Berkelbacteria bacterium]